jgi:hypothetical protein
MDVRKLKQKGDETGSVSHAVADLLISSAKSSDTATFSYLVNLLESLVVFTQYKL